jgi:hypothetical protein
MKHYVQIGADDVAAELYAKYPVAGNTLGNNRPESTVTDETAPGDASTETVITEGA